MGEHVKTAQRRLSTTRAFPSPSNPAIREKAREMEQMFHKWEWQRESWPLMVFLISPWMTKERQRAATLLQHRLSGTGVLQGALKTGLFYTHLFLNVTLLHACLRGNTVNR
ncbi:hypothetical protein PAMP_006109 [Pampus punctatissimus]